MPTISAPNEETREFIDTMGKLPKRFKTRWVKALRSGNYEQGQSFLFIEETGETSAQYCCLGVACVVQGKTKRFFDPLNNGSMRHIIPQNAKGIPALIRGTTENPVVGVLAGANDDGVSFARIAAWIEKYL